MSTSAGRPFTHGRRPAKRSLFGIVEIEADAGRAMMQTDITQPVDMNRVAEAVLAEFGQINILHNNAGVGELEDTTEARWHKIIDVNLSGAYRTCRRVIPAMQRQRRGAIVNISSVTGRLINRYPCFSYSAPKEPVARLPA